jgi:hypothetical protein
MYSKLTLNIRRSVIEKAKKSARRKKKSLSRLVEDYLEKLSAINSSSFVDDIIQNAPAQKTKKGNEKNILRSRLKSKHGS